MNTLAKKLRIGRLRFRFSLRTFLIVVVLLAMVLGLFGRQSARARRQKEAVDWILYHHGGFCVYDIDSKLPEEAELSKVNRYIPDVIVKVLVNVVGVDFFANVVEVTLEPGTSSPNNGTLDLSPLAQLHELRNLELHNINATDLSPLISLPKLKCLEMHHSNASDISSIAKMKELVYIDLTGCVLSDITPLANLPNLFYLNVSNTTASKAEVDVIRKAHPNMTIGTTQSIHTANITNKTRAPRIGHLSR